VTVPVDVGLCPIHTEGVHSKPRWPLAQVKTLAAEGRLLVTQRVCDVFPTQSEALLVVSNVLSELRLADFAYSAVLARHVADVYGVVVEGAGWYLKFSVGEDAEARAVVVISFHLLDRPLETRGGMVMP